MNLENRTYEQTAEIIGRIAEPAERILCDANLTEKIDALAGTKGAQQYGKTFGIFGALLNDAHRADTFTLIAALKGVPVEEVTAQPPEKLRSDVLEMLNELLGFFR